MKSSVVRARPFYRYSPQEWRRRLGPFNLDEFDLTCLARNGDLHRLAANLAVFDGGMAALRCVHNRGKHGTTIGTPDLNRLFQVHVLG